MEGLGEVSDRPEGSLPNPARPQEDVVGTIDTAGGTLYVAQGAGALTRWASAVFGVLASRGQTIALVKPQFEVGRGAVGKGGVVRDPAQHRAVVARLARYSILRGWHVLGVTPSPLRGPKGNREFFLHLSTHGRTAGNLEMLIEQSVEALA